MAGGLIGDVEDVFKDNVCYPRIGCFSNDPPFTNSWHQLPESPEKIGLQLFLFTRQNPQQGQTFQYDSAGSLVHTNFDHIKDVKVIIHGYLNNGSEQWNNDLKDALLRHVSALLLGAG